MIAAKSGERERDAAFHERRRLSMSDFPLDLFGDDAVVDAKKRGQSREKSEADENKRRKRRCSGQRNGRRISSLGKAGGCSRIGKRRIQSIRGLRNRES